MTDRVTQLVRLHRRAIHLEGELTAKMKRYSRMPFSRPPTRELASQFNALWRDVNKVLNEPEFENAIRPAWCAQLYPHGIIGALLLLSILTINLLLFYWYGLAFEGFMIVFALAIGAFAAISITSGWNGLFASSIEQLFEKTRSLEEYLRDYIEVEPAIASKVRFRNNADLEAQIRNLQTIRQNLESILEDTRLDYEDEIKRLRGEVTIWQQKWAGLQTPANFDIPEDVLAKLSNIEKARLVEAVQAYRVGAWTPAASVCGTILEG